MSAKALRARVMREARRDAVAFFREFRTAARSGQDELDWVAAAWADIRRDFKLKPDVADALWPTYWRVFSEETERLASAQEPPDQ